MPFINPLGVYLFVRVLRVGEDKRLRKFYREPGESLFDSSRSMYPIRLAGFWSLQVRYLCMHIYLNMQIISFKTIFILISVISLFFALSEVVTLGPDLHLADRACGGSAIHLHGQLFVGSAWNRVVRPHDGVDC